MICGWGRANDRRTIHGVSGPAGGGVVAERLPAVCGGVGVVAVCKASAVMSDVVGTISWVVVALIIGCLFFDED